MKRISYFILCWLGFIFIPYYLGEWLIPVLSIIHHEEPLLFFRWVVGFLVVSGFFVSVIFVIFLSIGFIDIIDVLQNRR